MSYKSSVKKSFNRLLDIIKNNLIIGYKRIGIKFTWRF